MHPYGCYSRPIRFIWFAIGAASATLWMNRDRVRSEYCHRPYNRPSVAYDAPTGSRRWDERDRASMEEKVTELSEATLESVLSIVSDLKAKLAEHKAECERQDERMRISRDV